MGLSRVFERKQPRPPAKVPKSTLKVAKGMCVCLDNQDVGLEAAMHLKSA